MEGVKESTMCSQLEHGNNSGGGKKSGAGSIYTTSQSKRVNTSGFKKDLSTQEEERSRKCVLKIPVWDCQKSETSFQVERYTEGRGGGGGGGAGC